MIGEIRALSRIWSFDRRFFFRSKSLTTPVLGLLHLEKVQQPRLSAKKTQTYSQAKTQKKETKNKNWRFPKIFWVWSIGANCHFFRCPFLFKQNNVVGDLINYKCVQMVVFFFHPNVNSILSAIYVDDVKNNRNYITIVFPTGARYWNKINNNKSHGFISFSPQTFVPNDLTFFFFFFSIFFY